MEAEESIGRHKYGGPHGLGDPDDLFLRKVETEVLIPKKMREIARKEKCVPEVEAFTECGRHAGLFLPFSCQKENNILKTCLTKWYENLEFQERCKKEYLAERTEFRRTGITQKKEKTLRELRYEIELEKEVEQMRSRPKQ